MSAEQEGEPHYHLAGEGITFATSFGVGWCSPSITEMIEDVGQRPAVAIGIIGITHVAPDPEPISVEHPIAMPWMGAAQLAGQLDALRDKLPEEFREQWEQEHRAAYAYAFANLDKIRLDGEPE